MPALLEHSWHSLRESRALHKVWTPDQQPPSTSPGSLLSMLPFRLHPRPAESESVLSQDLQVVLGHEKGGCFSLTSTIGGQFGFRCLHLAGSVSTPPFSIFQNLECSLTCYHCLLSSWKFTLFILHSDYIGVSRRLRDQNI